MMLCRGAAASLQAGPVEIICLILLPVAIVLCGYALFLFLWRSHMIAFAINGPIDDRRGPLVLASVVVLALCAIFILSIVDLATTMKEKNQHASLLFLSFFPGNKAVFAGS
jgi:hypothetical protein